MWKGGGGEALVFIMSQISHIVFINHLHVSHTHTQSQTPTSRAVTMCKVCTNHHSHPLLPLSVCLACYSSFRATKKYVLVCAIYMR